MFCNEGGIITSPQGGTGLIPGKIIFETGYHQLNCAELIDFIFRDSTKLVLEDSTTLEFPDSTTLHFSGNRTGLIMKPHSKLILGAGSKILFDSSASLIANGATFCGTTSNTIWNGIVFENSGKDSIINCTFDNAIISLKFLNGTSTATQIRLIKNNIFNVPSGGKYGVYALNCVNINIQDNTFNMPVSSGSSVYMGAYLRNNFTGAIAFEQGEGASDDGTMLNVVHNTFNNGTASLMIDNLISSYLPFYIANNTFYNSSSFNLLLLKSNGTVKNNNFTSLNKGIHMFSSSPNFFGNAITSTGTSILTIGYLYPTLSPVRTDDNLVWYGGQNHLESVTGDNIHLFTGGNVYTDLGHNLFITDDTAGYHIYGYIDTAVHNFVTRENCWYPQTVPRISLTRMYDSIPINYIKFYNYGFQCDPFDSPIGYDVLDMGSGVIDSTMYSADNTATTQTTEDILYEQALQYYEKEYYIDAIANYKELINNFPSEYYVQSVVYELYACYEALDTNSEQDYRNTLYGNLSVYLDDKIQTELYSEDFDYLAYDVMIMCAANIEDYDYALNGYEFISLFHPDPDIRLMASWDYAEIEALIDSGNGGGAKQLTVKQLTVNMDELKNSELAEQKEIKRINRIIRNDPVMSKLKKSFEKTSIERKDKIEKLIKADGKNINSDEIKNSLRKSAELDKLKNDKARRNLFELKNLSKDNLEKRRMEDIIILTKDFTDESDSRVNVSIPSQYVLEQNYPNPFNPTTTISYQLPKSGLVKIIVYDITGKEIVTLVNEYKQAGRFDVIFNGSNFASGIYFYKLESGDFVQTKKMLLIK